MLRSSVPNGIEPRYDARWPDGLRVPEGAPPNSWAALGHRRRYRLGAGGFWELMIGAVGSEARSTTFPSLMTERIFR